MSRKPAYVRQETNLAHIMVRKLKKIKLKVATLCVKNVCSLIIKISENPMVDDIKIVKRLLPKTTITNITKDLAKIAHAQKHYRVQIVLKEYLCNEKNLANENVQIENFVPEQDNQSETSVTINNSTKSAGDSDMFRVKKKFNTKKIECLLYYGNI